MQKTLFDPNISPKCEYCLYSAQRDARLVCTKNNRPAERTCRRYCYDPTMRVPTRQQRLPEYSSESFRID